MKSKVKQIPVSSNLKYFFLPLKFFSEYKVIEGSYFLNKYSISSTNKPVLFNGTII